MANASLDTSLVDRAILFAVKAHAGTERRGKGFPYIIHPMEAMEIVSTITPDPELLAAAALHDTVEDTGVTVEQIRAEFGDRVALIVSDESDRPVPGETEATSWRARKLAALDRLASASRDVKIVAMGDKLSNMRAIARDYAEKGDKLWDLFHAPGGKADHEWRYRELARALDELSDTAPYAEFLRLLDEVFGDAKPQLVDMSEYVQSGDGFNAISYNHASGTTMIKLYAESVPLSEIEQEYRMARSVLAMGIKTPEAKRMVTDGKRFGVEFERISPKKSFSRAIANDPSSLEKYAAEFARESLKFHSTPCNTSIFPSISDFYRKVVRDCKVITDSQKADVMAFIDSVPEKTTCIHGDLHIGNIITNGEQNWWIDLSEFAYGNPYYDLGMFFMVTNCTNDYMSDKIFHLNTAQMREVWVKFASVYFDGEDIEKVDALISKFTVLFMLKFSIVGKMMPEMQYFIDSVFPAR